MKIEQQDSTITLSKVYQAPRELVFQMFQNPHIKQWWGPTHWPVEVSDQDFRVGGSWHYNMVGPDGTKSWGKALYDEIDAPNMIVYRDYFSDADGNINESLPGGKTTVTFADQDGGTLLTMRGEYQSPEDIKKLTEMGMIEGVKDTWNQLEKLLEQAQEGQD